MGRFSVVVTIRPMNKRWAIGVLFAFFALACSSEGEVICEKLDECNILAAGFSVEDCAEEMEDLLNSSQLTDCATCVDEKSCNSIIGGSCNADCGGTAL